MNTLKTFLASLLILTAFFCFRPVGSFAQVDSATQITKLIRVKDSLQNELFKERNRAQKLSLKYEGWRRVAGFRMAWVLILIGAIALFVFLRVKKFI